MNRRQFLFSIALGVAGAMLPSGLRAEPAAASSSLQIHPDRPITHVPDDFMGLSYESGQLAHPDFFDRRNTNLVDYFRLLGRHGVLRIGGNSSAILAFLRYA